MTSKLDYLEKQVKQTCCERDRLKHELVDAKDEISRLQRSNKLFAQALRSLSSDLVTSGGEVDYKVLNSLKTRTYETISNTEVVLQLYQDLEAERQKVFLVEQQKGEFLEQQALISLRNEQISYAVEAERAQLAAKNKDIIKYYYQLEAMFKTQRTQDQYDPRREQALVTQLEEFRQANTKLSAQIEENREFYEKIRSSYDYQIYKYKEKIEGDVEFVNDKLNKLQNQCSEIALQNARADAETAEMAFASQICGGGFVQAAGLKSLESRISAFEKDLQEGNKSIEKLNECIYELQMQVIAAGGCDFDLGQLPTK